MSQRFHAHIAPAAVHTWILHSTLVRPAALLGKHVLTVPVRDAHTIPIRVMSGIAYRPTVVDTVFRIWRDHQFEVIFLKMSFTSAMRRAVTARLLCGWVATLERPTCS